ncbi:MAG TPA: sugar transferase [Dehalococcoidia bacterium]|nr:sugar transferase [Dehalococcoidia bacterium]
MNWPLEEKTVSARLDDYQAITLPGIRNELSVRVGIARRKEGALVKRVLDLALALPALIVLAPLMALTALAIKLDSRGPVFFRQERLGLEGEAFTMFKFRSMFDDTPDAEHRRAIEAFARGEPIAIEDGRGTYKPKQDARVTRVGRFLRASGLDELPQLFNVLRGEMSIVGPRPAIPYELDLYANWAYRRFAVRPGITGLWQVRRNDATNLEEMIRLDIEYVDKVSPLLDLKLIGATIPRIFFRGWGF